MSKNNQGRGMTTNFVAMDEAGFYAKPEETIQQEAPVSEDQETVQEQTEQAPSQAPTSESLGVQDAEEPKPPIAEKLEPFNSRGDIFARAQANSLEKPQLETPEPAKSMFRSTPTLDLSPQLQERYNNLGPTGKAAIDNLLAYIRAMRPRMPVEETARHRNQKMLYDTLKNVIKHSGDDFRKNMTAVMRFFREFNKPDEISALHDIYVNRDMANLNMNVDSLKQFPILIQLFKNLANVDERKTYLAQRDASGRFFEHVLRHDFSDEDIERVKAYFNQ